MAAIDVFGGHQFRVTCYVNPGTQRAVVRASVLKFGSGGTVVSEVGGETAALIVLPDTDEGDIWRIISDFAAEQQAAVARKAF